MSLDGGYLEFRECAGCGELFAIRTRFGRKAKWCSERCRKAQYQTPCIVCGALCGGSNKATYCATCGQAHVNGAQTTRRDTRETLVINLRTQGLTNYEIAERLDVGTPTALGATAHRAQRTTDRHA